MPIFMYSCNKCEHEFKELVLHGETDIACPDCRSKDIRKISSSLRKTTSDHKKTRDNKKNTQQESQNPSLEGVPQPLAQAHAMKVLSPHYEETRKPMAVKKNTQQESQNPRLEGVPQALARARAMIEEPHQDIEELDQKRAILEERKQMSAGKKWWQFWRSESEFPSQVMTDTDKQIAFVQSALQSLHGCRITDVQRFIPKWFVPAFNHWYCPAIRRGFSGTMAPLFDIGLLLVEPSVRLNGGDDAYATFLNWLRTSPLLDTARQILSTTPTQARPQVEWILIESLLRAVSGVWGNAAPEVRFLPWLKAEGSRVLLLAPEDRNTPLGSLEGLSLQELPISPSVIALPREIAVNNLYQQELPILLRLFIAHIAACQLSDVLDRLDYEVIEACLRGPNLKAQEHEPPPLHPTQVKTRTRSYQPGSYAGITRISGKRPEDPISDVLPSELMLLKQDEKAGMANLLYGRPLVNQHENEKDKIPKHRALVCFIVDACADRPPVDHLVPDANGHSYRHPYVYAKRQVSDLLHDLRDALEVVRHDAEVEIDVALFALSPDQEEAIVSRRFSLENIQPRRGGNRLDERLQQLMNLSSVAPDFFNRATGLLHDDELVPRTLVERHVSQFLRRQARSSSYQTIHIVLIAADSLMRFVAVVSRHLSFESLTRQQLLLIAVNMDSIDTDSQLIDEPQWQIGEAQTLHQAAQLIAGRLEVATLAKVRRHFVESIIGAVKKPRAGNHRTVQLA